MRAFRRPSSIFLYLSCRCFPTIQVYKAGELDDNMQILRRLIRSRSQRTAEGIHALISAIDKKVRGRESMEDLVSSLDAARGPLLGYLRLALRSPTAAKALTLKVLNLLLAKREFLGRSTTLLSRPYGLLVDPSCHAGTPVIV